MTFKTVASVMLLCAIGCGEDRDPLPVRDLNRPSDITFSCFGDLRVDGVVTTSAQPVASCLAHAAGTPPEGQEDIEAPTLQGFILQPSKGTVAVLDAESLSVQDSDLLTPGLNDIPIGTLPVSLETDRSGCFVIAANAGTCDLSVLDVSSAVDQRRALKVNQQSIVAPDGSAILAKPGTTAMGPQMLEVGKACPESPDGILFVTYPSCNLVAAVDAGTGQAVSGLVFEEAGIVRLATDADFDCPRECATKDDGTEAPSGGDKPRTVEFGPGGETLYLGSRTSPELTVVDLDEDGLPTDSIRTISLEGNVGITKIAVSDRINMGGDERLGRLMDPVGEFQFAYLIATDNTIRVVDLDAGIECDTQVDPRFLATETDVAFLSCMPVGDPRTPPRRFGAQGPGIQLPGRFLQGRNGQASLAVPLDVQFSTSPSLKEPTDVSKPDVMVGTFAFVTSATGRVFIINVDDDLYHDVEVANDPLAVSMPLGLAHQLRDRVPQRSELSRECTTPSADAFTLGARMLGGASQVINPELVSAAKVHELPFLQGLVCEGEDGAGNAFQAIVSELAFAAPAVVREMAFPDLRVVENQQWSLRWEGALSADPVNVHIDGPPIRKAVFAAEGDGAVLRDPAESFCNQGIQPYDILSLQGCDPVRGNVECGVGELCFVHPEAPATITTGVCLPEASVDRLATACKGFLVGRRRYSVLSAAKDELKVAERRRMLRSTPLDGCTSDEQCTQMAKVEALLSSNAHPVSNPAELPSDVDTRSWVCEADPSRKPGVDRCMMSCESTEDCESGFACSAGRCVEALVPPNECLQAVQRYRMFAGEAFSVLGEDDGFLHNIVADDVTGMCVESDAAHLLAVGRVPLRPEPCAEPGEILEGPNPCLTVVSHSERYTPYELVDGVCEAGESTVRVRETRAIRFANPALTFHLADTETTGDKECIGDRLGENPSFGAPYAGYQVVFDVGGGFLPMIIPGIEAAFPIRIVKGPSGNMWVLDQGDNMDSRGIVSLGRLFRFDPRAPGGFELAVVF